MKIDNACGMALNLVQLRRLIDSQEEGFSGYFKMSAAQIMMYMVCLNSYVTGPNDSKEQKELKDELQAYWTKRLSAIHDRSVPTTQVWLCRNDEVVAKIENLAVPIGYEQ